MKKEVLVPLLNFLQIAALIIGATTWAIKLDTRLTSVEEKQDIKITHFEESIEIAKDNRGIAEAIVKKLDREMVEAVYVNKEYLVLRMPPHLDEKLVKIPMI